MYPNDDNNNNNNNKMKKKSIKRERDGREEENEREEREERERDILIFYLFISFSDLRKLDRRFSSELKAKLIYAMRATRGQQKVGVSTNFVR